MVSHDIDLVPPTEARVAYLCKHLRGADAREISDTGRDAISELWRAYREGEMVFVAEVRGEPIAAFCVSAEATLESQLTPKHYCWLIATDKFALTGLGGLRKSLYNIPRIMQTFGHLFTFVRDDNRAATRYIQALGFKTDGRKSIFNGHPATYWERIS